jgi:hypothetical protein
MNQPSKHARTNISRLMEKKMSLSSDALTTTLCNSIQALGRGFDVTSDIRLLYCKGATGSRLVHIDEEHARDLDISHGLVLPSLSFDIDCSQEKRSFERIPVCSFHEVNFFFSFSFHSLSGHAWISLFYFLVLGSVSCDSGSPKIYAL